MKPVVIISIVLCVLFAGHYGRANVENQERELHGAKTAIDGAAGREPAEERVRALSDQYEISSETIESMRAEGLGWGEISAQLAIARRLHETQHESFPSYRDALEHVRDLREQKQGYGKIARDLGFELGPVIREVRREAHEIRTQTRSEMKQQREWIKDMRLDARAHRKATKDLVKESRRR